jgi:hypothetical protein
MAVDGNNKQIGPKELVRDLKYQGGRIVTPVGPAKAGRKETRAFHDGVAARRRRPLGTGEGWGEGR